MAKRKSIPNNEGEVITLNSVIERAAWLSADDMRRLMAWLEKRIPDQDFIQALNAWAIENQSKKREVVEGSQRIIKGVCYQQEKVRCGKLACRSCPHGPYWYAYFRIDGKQKSKYIGKDLKPMEPATK